MEADVFLDESGDLGWTFKHPYRNGGSSRYLTLAYLIVPRQSSHLPARVVRDCFNKWGADPKRELKGNEMSFHRREDVLKHTLKLMEKEPKTKFGAITVRKESVFHHLRSDPNKLYNYMIGLGMLQGVQEYQHVNLIRDNRSIKVEDGNSIGHYLQMQLWFHLGVPTVLKDEPTDSRSCKQLQLVDWLSYMVWSAYEDNRGAFLHQLRPYATLQRLFF